MSLYDVHCKLRKLQNVTQMFHSLHGFKLKSINQTSTTVAKTHMYYMKTIHLFAKYTTQSDTVLLRMFRRTLSFKYSASFVIISSMIILELVALVSHSLFLTQKAISEAIFFISSMDI